MVQELSPAAREAQRRGSEYGAANVPGTAPKAYDVELRETLPITDTVEATVRRSTGTTPEQPQARHFTPPPARTSAEARAEQAKIKTEMIDADRKRAELNRKLAEIDAKIASVPVEYQTIGRGRYASRQAHGSEDTTKLTQQRKIIERDLAEIEGRKAALQTTLGYYASTEPVLKRQETVARYEQAASPQALATRREIQERRDAGNIAAQAATAKTQALALASEYGYRVPSAYQIPGEYVTPGVLPEEQRQQVLKFIAEQQPGLVQKYPAVFETIPEPPRGGIAYTLSLTEGGGVRGPTAFDLRLEETLGISAGIGGEAVTPAPQLTRGEFRREALRFVKEAKAAGFTTISIKTPEGVKDVPISRAYSEMLRSEEILGVMPIPVIPEGSVVIGTIATPMTLQMPDAAEQRKQEKILREAEFARDPFGLSRAIYEQEQAIKGIGPRGPILPSDAIGMQLAGGFLSSLGTGYTGIQNLLRDIQIEGALRSGNKGLAVGATLASPKLYQAKPSGFEQGFMAPFVAGQEAISTGNVTEGGQVFIPALEREAKKSWETLQGIPIPAVIGQAGGFALLTAPTELRALSPLKITAVPIYTERGAVRAITTVGVGYGKKVFTAGGKYGEGGYFLGKYDPKKIIPILEKIEGSTGTFSRFEPSAYTARQQVIFRDIIREAEKQGIVKPGFVSTQQQIEKEVAKQRRLPWLYKRDVPSKLLESLPEGRPTYNVAETLGKEVKAGRLESVKGSIIALLGRERLARPAGDIDVEARMSEKLGRKIAKKESQLTELKAQARKETDQTKIRKLGTKIAGIVTEKRELEIKLMEPVKKTGLAFEKTDVGLGRKLERQGANIVLKEEGKKETPEIINIITPKEQIKNLLGELIEKGKVFGKGYEKKTVKFRIPGSKTKFPTKTAGYQAQAKAASITGIETEKSLSAARNLTTDDIKEIMQGYRFRMFPMGHRMKDITDFYMQTRDAARLQFLKGNRAGALESAKTMRMVQEYYGGKDFGKSLREYRPTLEVTPKEPKPSIMQSISGSASKVAESTAVPSALSIAASSSPRLEERRESPSIKITSARSPYRSMSARSSFGLSSKSSGIIKSGRPTGKPSVRPSGKPSAYSSMTSGASPLSAKPVSAKSVFAPSPQSPFAPSGRPSGRPSGKPSGKPSSFSGGISAGISGATFSGSPISTMSLSLKTPPAFPPRFPPTFPPRRLPKPFIKSKTDKQKPSPIGQKVDFIGNVPVSEIAGVYGKRADILYGKKTAKLAAFDVRKSARGTFTKPRKQKILSAPKQFFTPTKKQKRTMMRL